MPRSGRRERHYLAVTMTSKTVGDIFDAIEELAAGSTRLVKRRKVDGVDNLYVGFPDTKTEPTE